jgi:hypothetical protein
MAVLLPVDIIAAREEDLDPKLCLAHETHVETELNWGLEKN